MINNFFGNMISGQENECSVSAKWRIKEADLRNVREYESIETKTFLANIPGVKYFLQIFPHGRNLSERNRVKIILHLIFGMTKKINADVSFSVASADYDSISVKTTYDVSEGKECYLFTREELFDSAREFFVDGFMEIELHGTFKSQGIKRKSSKTTSLVNALWENDEQKNITILAEDQSLKIHKWILCTKSPVFKAELETEQFKEAQESKIVISDFSFETVKIAIKNCYEQNIKDLITEENAPGLLQFADKYDLKDLHDVVQTEVIQKLSELNVVRLANASLTSNSEKLKEFCVCFLIDQFGTSDFIDNIEELKDEIAAEVCRRSFPSVFE